MKSRKTSLSQRIHFRIPAEFTVEFYVMKYKRRNVTHLSGKKGLGLGQDIGEGGLSFISPYLLPVDMIVRLSVDLPEYGIEPLLARVVRAGRTTTGGYLTGVQFFNLPPKRREHIRNYVINQAKKQYNFLKYL